MITIQGEIAALGEGLITGTTGSPQAGLTVRASAAAWVQAITLANTDTAERTANVYITRGGTRRRISPKDLNLRPRYLVTLNDGYSLQAGHKIEFDASAAGVIEYSIHGIERAQ